MSAAYPTVRDRLRAILTDDVKEGRLDFDLDGDAALWRYHDMRVERLLDAAAKRGFDDFDSIQDELDFADLEDEWGTLDSIRETDAA